MPGRRNKILEDMLRENEKDSEEHDISDLIAHTEDDYDYENTPYSNYQDNDDYYNNEDD